MVAVIGAIGLALAFGGADQYLGSLSAHPWATDVSLLSAPWLLLAFLAGWTQPTARRAVVLGLACAGAALAGYGLMTLSPIENAHLTSQSVIGFIRSETRVIVGGLFAGPLFGWLGHGWRNHRALLGALAAAGAVCLEPVARLLAGDPIRFRTVWVGEVAVGLAMLIYISAEQLRGRRGPA
jgi:Family of unknown function (DUF6518)